MTKKIITTLLLIPVILFGSYKIASAQNNSEVIQRANDVANFYDKNVPQGVKDFISKATLYLEQKRIDVNTYANSKVDAYKNKPAEQVVNEGFDISDVKIAVGTFVYYIMIGISYVSANPYLFWGIILLVIGLIFKRLFR